MSSTFEPESLAAPSPTPSASLDLDRIEADLADVDVALARLDSGEYWRDEVTGAALDDDLLARRPTARRAEPAADDTTASGTAAE